MIIIIIIIVLINIAIIAQCQVYGHSIVHNKRLIDNWIICTTINMIAYIAVLFDEILTPADPNYLFFWFYFWIPN